MINKYIIYNNEKIEYKINRGKRKRVYIGVRNGEVEVKVPSRFPEEEIKNIVFQKANWIKEALKKYPKVEMVDRKYNQGETFYILGNIYRLNIIYSNENNISIDDIRNTLNVFIKKSYLIDEEKRKAKIKNMIDKYYLDVADREISFAMEKRIKELKIMPSSFKVRNFKRAWGNCSSKKVISINQEIVKYSRNAIDYVCLHELCHLKYMNHSKDFWNMVKTYMPNYKLAEEELREKRQ